MHLVDDVHALFDRGRRIARLLADVADVVHTIVRGRVDLDHIEHRPVQNAAAGRALAAWVAVFRMLAVDRARQDFGAGGLACAARTGKKVGMRQAAADELAAQCVGNVLLADDVRKSQRPPFAVKRLIHGLPPSDRKSGQKLCPLSIPFHCCKTAPHKTVHRPVETTTPTAFPVARLKTGKSTAHGGFCLMLLGSPPDMVHSPPLRSTSLSSPPSGLRTSRCRPSRPEFVPAGADCRYRAPLPPQLVRPCAALFRRWGYYTTECFKDQAFYPFSGSPVPEGSDGATGAAPPCPSPLPPGSVPSGFSGSVVPSGSSSGPGSGS